MNNTQQVISKLLKEGLFTNWQLLIPCYYFLKCTDDIQKHILCANEDKMKCQKMSQCKMPKPKTVVVYESLPAKSLYICGGQQDDTIIDLWVSISDICSEKAYDDNKSRHG